MEENRKGESMELAKARIIDGELTLDGKVLPKVTSYTISSISGNRAQLRLSMVVDVEDTPEIPSGGEWEISVRAR